MNFTGMIKQVDDTDADRIQESGDIYRPTFTDFSSADSKG